MDPTTRLARLQSLLTSLEVDALLIEQPLALFYLLGIELSAGQLLVSSQSSLLLVDGRYSEAAKKQKVAPTAPQSLEVFKQWCKQHQIRTLGVTGEQTTILRWRALDAELSSLGIQLHALVDPVMRMRIIKDAYEIDALRKAAQLTVAGIQYAETLLYEGVQEDQIALELEIFWRRAGGQRLAFDPIIAFGTHSSMPHYRAGFAQLGQHDAVLIDAGVVVQGYHGDCTRFFPRHHCPPQLALAQAAVYEAQQAAIAAVAPGVPLARLDTIARDVLRKHGLEPYFTHSLGHGVGLEIHEPPRLKEDGPDCEVIALPGMVFTIEPGVYLPGIGGVRLEEMVLVTDSGHEVLTSS
jgi:Xaa-Pro aminopeptidase